MGYTHHWTISDPKRFAEIWAQLIVDTNLIIELANIPLSCDGPLLVADSAVAFRAGHLPSHSHNVPCRSTDSGLESVVKTKVCASIETGVQINGVQDDGHQLFVLQSPVVDDAVDDADEGVWRLCKTARKPYDLVVSTILMRAKILAVNAFDLWSDGVWNYDEQWIRASKFYTELWPGDELTAAKLGLEEWNEDEKRAYEEKYGVGADERSVAAEWNKELAGPVMAIIIDQLRGKEMTREQREWLMRAPPTPLNTTTEGEKNGTEARGKSV